MDLIFQFAIKNTNSALQLRAIKVIQLTLLILLNLATLKIH